MLVDFLKVKAINFLSFLSFELDPHFLLILKIMYHNLASDTPNSYGMSITTECY